VEKTEYLQAAVALSNESRRESMIAAKKIIYACMLLLFISIPVLAEEIHDAAQQGDLVKIKSLLEKSPGLLEARSENEKTPLHFAAQGGHKEIVELLVEDGADVNARNIALETPLHYAAAMGYKEIVDLLISEGALLNSGTTNGSTPLHYSANIGNSEIIQVLIEKGADINCRNKYGLTPLDLAYDFNQNEAAQLIVSKGGFSSPVDDPDVVRLSDNFYSILFPKGNQTNLVVSVGNDGILLVDTGFSRRAETKLRAAISRLGDGRIKYIINTHLHQDHVACNNIGGESAIVINHQNLEKMASEGIIVRAEGSIKGKTDKTFKSHYTMTFNGEEIKLIPYPGVHSNEDLIIYLSGSGVVHMGDLLLSESFPSVGGNVVEYMELLEKIIDIFPADTLFINGHGKNCTLEDVVKYQRMLFSSIEIVRNHMKPGKSIKEMRRENVLKDFKKWDSFIYFLNTDYWIGAVYNSYKDKQEESFAPEPNLIAFSRIEALL
jgi:glyoxylase-like metal-dependent hydrolase (beta-lactamase superfamily II)